MGRVHLEAGCRIHEAGLHAGNSSHDPDRLRIASPNSTTPECPSANGGTIELLISLLAFLLAFACCEVVDAQEAKSQSDPRASVSVQAFEHRWSRQLKNGSAEEISNLLADDFVRVDTEGHRQNRDDYLASIRSGRMRVEECAIERIEIKSRNTFAVVTTTFGVVGMSNDHDISGFYQIIDTIELQETGWRAVSRSETKIASRTDPLWERAGKPCGKPRVVLFVLGSFCPHCMSQLSAFAKDLSDQNCLVSVVSADTEEDLKKFPDVPFTLVADPNHQIFRRFGAFKGEAKHATVAMDGRGKLVFRSIGDKPYMNAEVVKLWIDKAAAESLQLDTNK